LAIKYSFHRPHDRVQEDGSIVNHRTGEVTYPPSKTKQSFLAECDINRILKQFSVTGQINHVNARAALGAYVDLPDQIDFQTALNTVVEGERAFGSLPAKLRERFGNDPAEFLGFLADENNRPEALKLGLINPPQPSPTPTPSPDGPPSGEAK